MESNVAELVKILDKTEYEAKAIGKGAACADFSVGGKTAEFQPELRVSWKCGTEREQFFLDIAPKTTPSLSLSEETLLDGKLSKGVGDDTHTWYPVVKEFDYGDGAKKTIECFKWDVSFPSKPASNKSTYVINHSEDISFGRVCSRADIEAEDDMYRPVELDGSYSVYCNESGVKVGSDGSIIHNYGAGKLGVLLRPFCTDADDKESWADLLLSPISSTQTELIITIDQKFLDTARYPITLDPSLGQDESGDTKKGLPGAGYAVLGRTRNAMPEDGTLLGWSIFVADAETTSRDIFGVCYVDGGEDNPTTLVDHSEPFNGTDAGAADWDNGGSGEWSTNDGALDIVDPVGNLILVSVHDGALSNGDKYYIGLYSEGGAIDFWADTGADNCVVYNDPGFTDPAVPISPWETAGQTTKDWTLSAYIAYSVTGTTIAPTTVAPTSLPPTSLPPTSLPPTSLAPTSLPPTSLPPTSLAPTTLPPTTLAPTSLAPTSLPPTTLAPTSLPPTTIAPTSLAPTTLPPTSLPPTSLPPTSLPPTTVAPTTLAPTSLAPTTLAPTSLPPTSLPPTSLPPTSLPPTTISPTTLAPTTLAPTSIAPTSLPPTSLPPTSLPPTSLPPTSLPPTSLAPTSIAPTTLAPTSLAPTSLPPTSVAPTTIAPTSLPPTSLAPTTIGPTTIPPTSLPPTSLPPTTVGPTSIPPTSLPPTSAAPTTAGPTSLPPTTLPPTTSLTTAAPPTTEMPVPGPELVPAVKAATIPHIKGIYCVSKIVSALAVCRIDGVCIKPSIYGIFN